MGSISRKITKGPVACALDRYPPPRYIPRGAPLPPKPPKPTPPAYWRICERRALRLQIPLTIRRAPRHKPPPGAIIIRGNFGIACAVARYGGRLYELHPTKGWRGTRDQGRWSGP